MRNRSYSPSRVADPQEWVAVAVRGGADQPRLRLGDRERVVRPERIRAALQLVADAEQLTFGVVLEGGHVRPVALPFAGLAGGAEQVRERYQPLPHIPHAIHGIPRIRALRSLYRHARHQPEPQKRHFSWRRSRGEDHKQKSKIVKL